MPHDPFGYSHYILKPRRHQTLQCYQACRFVVAEALAGEAPRFLLSSIAGIHEVLRDAYLTARQGCVLILPGAGHGLAQLLSAVVCSASVADRDIGPSCGVSECHRGSGINAVVCRTLPDRSDR